MTSIRFEKAINTDVRLILEHLVSYDTCGLQLTIEMLTDVNAETLNFHEFKFANEQDLNEAIEWLDKLTNCINIGSGKENLSIMPSIPSVWKIYDEQYNEKPEPPPIPKPDQTRTV